MMLTRSQIQVSIEDALAAKSFFEKYADPSTRQYAVIPVALENLAFVNGRLSAFYDMLAESEKRNRSHDHDHDHDYTQN